MASDFEQLFGLWQDGQRRIRQMEPRERTISEGVVHDVYLELRRRLGGRFTTNELAAYFLREGTDWVFQIAYTTAPSTPEAWDMSIIAGAAFARYARHAADYGGGTTYFADDDEA